MLRKLRLGLVLGVFSLTAICSLDVRHAAAMDPVHATEFCTMSCVIAMIQQGYPSSGQGLIDITAGCLAGCLMQ